LVEPRRASDASDDTAAAVVTFTTAASSSPGWLRYEDEFRGATATLYVVLGYTTKSPYVPLSSVRCILYAPLTSTRVSLPALGNSIVLRKYGFGGAVAFVAFCAARHSSRHRPRQPSTHWTPIASKHSPHPGYSLALAATTSTAPGTSNRIATTNVSAPTRSMRGYPATNPGGPVMFAASPPHPPDHARSATTTSGSRHATPMGLPCALLLVTK
jgi:hypothetical protein